jgi:hypothetical protein
MVEQLTEPREDRREAGSDEAAAIGRARVGPDPGGLRAIFRAVLQDVDSSVV